MVIAQQGGGGVLYWAAPLLWPALAGNSWFFLSVNFLALCLLGLPLLAYILLGLPDLEAPEKARVRGGHFALLALVSMPALFALSAASDWLGKTIGELKGGEVQNPLDALVGDASPWALLLFVVIIAPLAEEYIFRGLLYKKLAGYGAKTYILVSALLFALYHANLYQMFYAFALGLPLAWLTYASGNIRASVALHLLINLIGSGLPLLPTTAYYAAAGLLCAGGVLAGVVLASRRGALPMPLGACEAPRGREVFGNAGMIALLLVLGGLTVLVAMV